jgi:tape measure domain-containing protein
MSTLDKLKQKLNLSGAAKGLDDINTAAKNNGMSGLGAAVESVHAKFSALSVVGVTALANITNSAVNAGKKMISALTIDPIKTGFSEYETKINAIQTIMSNTASKGTTMEDVTRVIGELNTYADKTIYNFAEMTRNIGTFTAAGVGLEDSATSIQGIANLAAASGSTSQQASTAMYQLSQAMAAGTVKLMDWNSVVNAGMGGQKFQDALKVTAREHGIAVDDMIESAGSFRESLKDGWITTEVLNDTLKKFTVEGAKDYAKAMVESGEYTKEQADALIKEAQAMEDAATKVKTFTQLWDTLKESAQSGWSQTWEILIGDFEEAKETLTEISTVIGKVIEASANARNELLQGWKDAGGRADIVESIFNVFKAIGSVAAPIKEAFREIFPPITVENLKNFSEGLKEFTAKLSLSSETAEKVKRTFKGVFSILDIGKKVVMSVADAIAKLFGSEGASSLLSTLLDITAGLGDFFTKLNEGFDAGGISGFLSTVVDLVSDVITGSIGPIKSFGDAVVAVGDFLVGVANKIWDGVKPAFDWIRENVSAGDIFAGLAGGGIFIAAKKLSGLLDNIVDAFKNMFGKDGGAGIKEQFGEVLGGVKDALSSFSTGLKVSSIVSIAVAVGILSASLKSISEINVADTIKSLTAIGIMMGMLSVLFSSITKTLDTFKPAGLIKASVSLILIATAINVLASAMEKIGNLPLKDIGKGLIGIGGGLAELAIGLKIIGKTKISLSTSVAMIALAKAFEILGDALHKFSELTWDEIGRGLVAMGGALAEFVATISIMSKLGGFKSLIGSLSILVLVQSLSEMAEGLKKFGEMSWGEIGKGLSAMGGALAELSISLGALGKVAGFSSLFAAGSMSMLIQGLGDLADALKSFGEMAWDEIGRGLTSMGGALGELAISLGVLGKLGGFSSLFASGSMIMTIQGLDDLANALEKFGSMKWNNIGTGLAAMGLALAEVAGISGALGKFAGFSGIFGAGTILITIQGLGDLSEALKKFSEMSWSEIGRGLTAMGGALLEVSVISGALGTFAGLAAILGGAAIWTVVQGLDDLANALKKFGSMSWDEIKRGITAMGDALTVTAFGGFLNSFASLGSFAISEIAGSLGTLADSVKKWEGVTVPDGLGKQLGSLANGVEKFTFAGAGAGALSESAGAVGTLADSVKKWSGVSIPDGLPGKFNTLATAVRKFWDAGLGSSALVDSAKSFGDLADSVKKWNGVTVPDNIQDSLSQIANGIKSFTFAFAGGWSISSIITPLSELPGAISKWNGVTVPEGLDSQLKSLANGIKAFGFAFAGGWSMETVIGPLGNLAGSIQKWAGVTIPEGLGESLKSLANGIRPFAGMGDISLAASSVGSLVSSMQNLSRVNFAGISSGFSGFAASLSNLSSISNVSAAISQLVATIQSTLAGAASIMAAAGTQMMSSLAMGISSGIGLVQAIVLMTSMMATTSFMSSTPMYIIIGTTLATALANGISNGGTAVSAAIRVVVVNASNIARTAYSGFYQAGAYCVQGFANGITAYTFIAEARARAMAEAALQAARRQLGVASPSKEFYAIGEFSGIGLINALRDYTPIVGKAGAEMADGALDGFGSAISRINNMVASDLNAQPTIRPILDLSSIQNGTGLINSLFASRTMSLAGANAGYSRTTQADLASILGRIERNGGNNSEMANAISELRGDFGSLVNAINNMSIVLDDGTVVGRLITKIDIGLGKIATYKGRGN